MKTDLDIVLRDMNDESDLRTPDDKPFTLRLAIQTSLGNAVKGDEAMSLDDKYKLWRLGKRCKGDSAHLTAQERTLILDRVSKAYPSVVIYGQVRDLLDPPEEEQPRANGGAHESHAGQ
jgi:hypothetical protein